MCVVNSRAFVFLWRLKKAHTQAKKTIRHKKKSKNIATKRRAWKASDAKKRKKREKRGIWDEFHLSFLTLCGKLYIIKTHNNSKHGAERIRAPRAHDSGRFVSILHLLFDPYRKRSTFASRVYVDERMRVLKICGVAWSLFFVRGNVETSRARLRWLRTRTFHKRRIKVNKNVLFIVLSVEMESLNSNRCVTVACAHSRKKKFLSFTFFSCLAIQTHTFFFLFKFFFFSTIKNI